MNKTLIVAVVFCLPLLTWMKPSYASTNFDVFKALALPNSSEQIWVISRIKGTATAYYAPREKEERARGRSYKQAVLLNGQGGKTATGKKPRIGTLSANLKKYPPNTWLRITNVRTGERLAGVVEDTGYAMQHNSRHIDIFIGVGQKGCDRALTWGRQDAIIEKIQLALY